MAKFVMNRSFFTRAGSSTWVWRAKLSNEGAKIEAPKVTILYDGGVWGGGVPLHIGNAFWERCGAPFP